MWKSTAFAQNLEMAGNCRHKYRIYRSRVEAERPCIKKENQDMRIRATYFLLLFGPDKMYDFLDARSTSKYSVCDVIRCY